MVEALSWFGYVDKTDGIMNTEKDCQIFHHTVPSGKHLTSNSFIIKHDSDPKHTPNAVKTYLAFLISWDFQCKSIIFQAFLLSVS